MQLHFVLYFSSFISLHISVITSIVCIAEYLIYTTVETGTEGQSGTRVSSEPISHLICKKVTNDRTCRDISVLPPCG